MTKRKAGEKRKFFLTVCCGLLLGIGLALTQEGPSIDSAKVKKELGDFVKEQLLNAMATDFEADIKKWSEENLPREIDVTLKIPTSLEKRFRDGAYINEMLRDVKFLGYDLSNVSLMQLVLDYNKLDQDFRKVWLEGTREKKSKFTMTLESRKLLMDTLTPLLGRALDEKTPAISGEIVKGFNDLLWDAYEKNKTILENLAEIETGKKDPSLDWSDALKKKFKISGNLFDYFQDFELNYRGIKDQIGDPAALYQAYVILSKGMNSPNPGDKIGTLLKLMSTFGGKMPILGKFIELYAQIADEMINAIGRLAEVLRKRQGFCVGTGTTGQIAGKFQDERSRQFAKQFPDGGTACPFFDEGVYKNIYVDINNQGNLYFWGGGSFIKGQPFGGIEAVKRLIVWLRKTGHATESDDAGFLGNAYNLAPGFLERDRQAKEVTDRLRTGVRNLRGQLGLCSKDALQKFILGEGRMQSVLDRLSQDSEQVENFPYEDDLFVDRIHDDAIFKGTDTFWKLCQDVATRLEALVVYTIEGKIVDEDGRPQAGMTVAVRPEASLLRDCSRLTSDSGGGFIATLFKLREENLEASVQAQDDKRQSDEQRIPVAGGASVYTCTLSVEGTPIAFISLTPSKKSITLGGQFTFKLSAELVDGTTKTIDNSRAVWVGAEAGVFVGATVGLHGVTATYRTKQASAAITVTGPKSLTVTKNLPKVKAGDTVAFEAIAVFEGGSTKNVTNEPETTFTPGKEVTYPTAGDASVSAAYQGLTGTLQFKVEERDATLVIIPENETAVIEETVTFTVNLARQGGSSEDVTAKCVPANPAFTAKEVGRFLVSVTYATPEGRNLTATATLTVRKVDRLVVEPGTVTLKLNEARDFTARAVFSDGTSADVTGKASWNPEMRFSSKKAGKYPVTASYGGAVGRAAVTVTEEQGDDPCAQANLTASIEKLNSLIANVKQCRARVDMYYNKFLKEAGSMGDKKICNNFIIAYCYVNGRSNAVRIVDFVLEIEDIASEALMVLGLCPDLAKAMKTQGQDVGSIVTAVGSVKGASEQCAEKVNGMLGRLNENGCDESEVIRAGENNVRPDQDPDNIKLLDGTPAPVCYDTWLTGNAFSSQQNWSMDGKAEGLADFDLNALRFAGQKQGSVSLPDGSRGTFAYTGNTLRILLKRTVLEKGKNITLTYTFIGSDSGRSLLLGTYSVEGSDGRKQRGNWKANKK